MGRYRKTLAAGLLGVVELAAYIAADPRDLPSWVVTAALAVNAAAVYFVRNQPPPQVAPTLFASERLPDDVREKLADDLRERPRE